MTDAQRERINYLRRLRRKSRAKAHSSITTPLGEALKKALNQNSLYLAADKAVPKNYAGFKRDDIVASLVLAVLEGEITQCQIPAAVSEHTKQYNRQYNRQYDLYKSVDFGLVAWRMAESTEENLFE